MARTTSAEERARLLAEEHAYRAEVWWVRPAGPLRGLWCTEGEAAALLAVCWGMGRDAPEWVALPPQEDGQRWVDLGGYGGLIAAHEGFMRSLVGCMRRNGIHGTYRKAGDSRTYNF